MLEATGGGAERGSREAGQRLDRVVLIVGGARDRLHDDAEAAGRERVCDVRASTHGADLVALRSVEPRCQRTDGHLADVGRQLGAAGTDAPPRLDESFGGRARRDGALDARAKQPPPLTTATRRAGEEGGRTCRKRG